MFDSNKKHAVLFGGAGFIGTELIGALCADHWTVTAVTKHPHRHRNLLVIPTLQMVESGDLSDQQISDLVSESDTVINLIGILNQSRKETFADLHTYLPERIARICLQNGARRLINMSALGAAVDAPSEYLKSRGLGEQALQAIMQQGLDCTIIRPSIVFGSGDSFSQMFRQLLSMTPVLFPLVAPNARVQPVYVKDVVDCIIHAIAAEPADCGSFDVAGPQTYTLRELIGLIDQLAGMRHRIIGLNRMLSRLLATFTQFAPGKPLTPDNLRSLYASNAVHEDTPEPYGIQSTRFESVAGAWLNQQSNRFDRFRMEAGR